MRLDDHLAQVQDQISATAALGDERTREIAASLATAASPAVRLAILQAVSAAADEITAALLDLPGAPAVSIRLDADDVVIGVAATDAVPISADLSRDDDTSARISLRLSEALKAEVDAAAARDGVSVNTWLVRTASAAVTVGPAGSRGGRRTTHHDHDQHRVTGWING